MGKKAVDVALLPSEEIMGRAIELNKKIATSLESNIKLNKKDCLPHITLAMGCMDDNDLAKIGKILKQIAEKNKTLSLKTLSGPTDKACFEIYNNSFLKLLHETVMNELEPYLTYDVDKTMINKSCGKINALTIDYIKHFRAESAFDKFTPHITLGSGEASLDIPEIHFKASKIALCHLGNFCTCRKILYHTLLSPEDKQ